MLDLKKAPLRATSATRRSICTATGAPGRGGGDLRRGKDPGADRRHHRRHARQRPGTTSSSPECPPKRRHVLAARRGPLDYHEDARVRHRGRTCRSRTASAEVVIATGGTSDIPVAEEAALTARGAAAARWCGCTTWAWPGVHRLLAHMDAIMEAHAWSSPSRAWRGRWPAWWAVWRNAR